MKIVEQGTSLGVDPDTEKDITDVQITDFPKSGFPVYGLPKLGCLNFWMYNFRLGYILDMADIFTSYFDANSIQNHYIVH